MGKDLAALCYLLTTSFIPELIDNYFETLVAALLGAITKGSVLEALKATHCLSVVFVSKEEHSISVDLYEDCFNKLEAVGKTHQHSSVKLGAFVCIAVMTAVGCNDDSKNEIALKYFSERAQACRLQAEAKEKVESVSIEAEGLLRSWIILMTVLPTEIMGRLNASPTSELWNFALKCLLTTSPSLKIVSGEIVGLLVEAKYKTNSVFSIEKMERTHPNEMAEILQLADSSHKRNLKGITKEEKRILLSVFRDVAETIRTGESPVVSTCIGHRSSSLTLKSWMSINRHAFLRAILKGALASHLKGNQTARRLIGFDQLHGAEYVEENEEVKTQFADKTRTRDIDRKKERMRKGEVSHGNVGYADEL
eukprot:GHVP01033454.1.p1 GENE.GHVP01033454.1~~GHVP01033454.1.p1  ORF type:complete len:421 (+),score=72.87 GHVP01033454.1:168-1265(+)